MEQQAFEKQLLEYQSYLNWEGQCYKTNTAVILD